MALFGLDASAVRIFVLGSAWSKNIRNFMHHVRIYFLQLLLLFPFQGFKHKLVTDFIVLREDAIISLSLLEHAILSATTVTLE